jgi:hypothetical protein
MRRGGWPPCGLSVGSFLSRTSIGVAIPEPPCGMKNGGIVVLGPEKEKEGLAASQALFRRNHAQVGQVQLRVL